MLVVVRAWVTWVVSMCMPGLSITSLRLFGILAMASCVT